MKKPDELKDIKLPKEVEKIMAASSNIIVANNIQDLVKLSCKDAREDGWHIVDYEVEGKGKIREAKVCQVKNGIAANYIDPYMRRRDPECMLIADDLPTDKERYSKRFGESFENTRKESFEWLKKQELCMFFFKAGPEFLNMDVIAIAPANAGFFALGLALLQGITDPRNLGKDYNPQGVIYVVPPFRHTHFDEKQVVVHNRTQGNYEMFSYNLYPGPSAKKGVYGMLIDKGEQEDWVTLHCSSVRVVTPYDNKITIVHEGASGGGKSEMLEDMQRERNGRLLLGENILTGESAHLSLSQGCSLQPVSDDMAVSLKPSEKNNKKNGKGKMHITDAENAWFIRVNHITQYGIQPHLEKLSLHPPEPLLFLNINAVPDSTALMWDHIEDEPNKPCPNPRVVIPRSIVPETLNGDVRVDVRSFGVRVPPCTKNDPTYGIVGLFHVLPPALAWLWRLVAPRGYGNPSIVNTEGMSSEGVGSYWPFATGKKVKQANLLLRQILESPKVRYVLIPNQHIGAWKTGFMPQWITREYLARRGGAWFTEGQLTPARCPLLGYALKEIMIEGTEIEKEFLRVETQPEVGNKAYDEGSGILKNFFKKNLREYLQHPELDSLGKKIIKCCLNDGSLEDYTALIDSEPIINED